eukprot:snap_masked-scaffold_13-processed-gene-5.10-mRNA-1 protein AED:1.00 eAED:1.00 QI:0/0/0/0/1/1/2/0/63
MKTKVDTRNKEHFCCGMREEVLFDVKRLLNKVYSCHPSIFYHAKNLISAYFLYKTGLNFFAIQ